MRLQHADLRIAEVAPPLFAHEFRHDDMALTQDPRTRGGTWHDQTFVEAACAERGIDPSGRSPLLQYNPCLHQDAVISVAVVCHVKRRRNKRGRALSSVSVASAGTKKSRPSTGDTSLADSLALEDLDGPQDPLLEGSPSPPRQGPANYGDVPRVPLSIETSMGHTNHARSPSLGPQAHPHDVGAVDSPAVRSLQAQNASLQAQNASLRSEMDAQTRLLSAAVPPLTRLSVGSSPDGTPEGQPASTRFDWRAGLSVANNVQEQPLFVTDSAQQHNAHERDCGRPLLDSSSPLRLMVLDLEYDDQEGTNPVVRLFGSTQEGCSVLLDVHGFLPFFYVLFSQLPDPSDDQLEELRHALEQRLRANTHIMAKVGTSQLRRGIVDSVERILAESLLLGYQANNVSLIK
ncbi:hypothetical protein B484DRAFT_461198, partial [Ochromonadaceae sp. CCMP2298]